MPTYEYKCTKCGHLFETQQKMSDAPVTKCPECGGLVDKLISGGAGLIFKGSGFYITDYRKAGYKKDSDKDSPKKETKEKSESPSKPSSESSTKPSPEPSKPKTKSSD